MIYPLLKTNQDELITMTVLNKESNIGSYFNNAASSINVGDNIIWKIQLYNGVNIMGYYSIKIKMVNLDEPSPDIISLTPTNATTIFQIHKVLGPSGEIGVPFSWKIVENKTLEINNNTIPVNFNMDKGLKLKIIFELWKYNTDTHQFEFKILIGEKYTCIWNQINFKIE